MHTCPHCNTPIPSGEDYYFYLTRDETGYIRLRVHEGCFSQYAKERRKTMMKQLSPTREEV